MLGDNVGIISVYRNQVSSIVYSYHVHVHRSHIVCFRTRTIASFQAEIMTSTDPSCCLLNVEAIVPTDTVCYFCYRIRGL